MKPPSPEPLSIAPLSVALWAVNLAGPLEGLEDWVARLDARLADAKAGGADLLVLPEYVSEQWLSFAPDDLPASQEIAWMAGQAGPAIDAAQILAVRHGLALLAGTVPVRVPAPGLGDNPFRNRAHLLLPDGRRVAQDKLCLTPDEKDPAGWHLGVGDAVEIVQWRGLRLAILICLDVELPALAAALAPHEPDLILVPSMTEKASGYARVFSCAKARAVELQSLVCAVGTIGQPVGRHANVSGAAVFAPCEEALGYDGVLADIPPRDSADGLGPLLIVKDLPLAILRALRGGKAEVWPGAWRADAIRIEVQNETVPIAEDLPA